MAQSRGTIRQKGTKSSLVAEDDEAEKEERKYGKPVARVEDVGNGLGGCVHGRHNQRLHHHSKARQMVAAADGVRLVRRLYVASVG